MKNIIVPKDKTDIAKAAREAINKASSLGMDCILVFNGVNILVKEDDTVISIWERYNEKFTYYTRR